MKVERYCPESPEFRVSISFGHGERVLNLAESFELLDGLCLALFERKHSQEEYELAGLARQHIDAHYEMWAAQARVRETSRNPDVDPERAAKNHAEACCAASQANQRINDTWLEMLEMHGSAK